MALIHIEWTEWDHNLEAALRCARIPTEEVRLVQQLAYNYSKNIKDDCLEVKLANGISIRVPVSLREGLSSDANEMFADLTRWDIDGIDVCWTYKDKKWTRVERRAPSAAR